MQAPALGTLVVGLVAVVCGCSTDAGATQRDAMVVQTSLDGSVAAASDASATSTLDAAAGDRDGGPLGPAHVGDGDAGAFGDDAGPQGTRSACKRGVAYGHHSKADFAALSPGVAWWYNWARTPDDALKDGSYAPLGVEYVPMIWGQPVDVTAASTEIPQGAHYLLGFNEPNFKKFQANLSASEAAALWPKVEAIADARDLELVSPAVNYCGPAADCHDTDPFHYLDAFFAACHGCRVDHIAFHVYVGCHPDGSNMAKWLIEKVEAYKQRYSQPLWLTEFACTDAENVDVQKKFMLDAVAYLEGEPRVKRYAWFSGRTDIRYAALLGGDGQLTALGQAYVAAPKATGCH